MGEGAVFLEDRGNCQSAEGRVAMLPEPDPVLHTARPSGGN